MKFTVRYENFEKPIGTNDFIEKKIQKLEKFKHLDETVKINIALSPTGFQTNMAVIVDDVKEPVAADAVSQDINTSIDECLDRLIGQVIKIKEKRRDNNH